jgi:hypothetical protein
VIQKLEKENAELKKTVEHYRKEREFFIGEVGKMTDKEMAEKWVDYHYDPAVKLTRHSLEWAYHAGLKESKPLWHDLKEDPDDLPKNMIEVLGLSLINNDTLIPTIATYSHFTKSWHPDYDDEEVINIVYWQEIIPPLEEIEK